MTILVAAGVQLASFLSLLTYMYFYYQPYPTLIAIIPATAALVGTSGLAGRFGAEWPRFRSPFQPDRSTTLETA